VWSSSASEVSPMYKLISIRCKGGSSEFEERQMAALAEQEKLQEQLSAVDLEFYQMRQDNKAQYDEQFRPMEEGLLRRAAGPATESTSAEGRSSEYAAADVASNEALARRNERFGISNGSAGDRDDDAYIRAIALTAVGNQSKMSALETQGKLGQAALGIGVGVNQDIGRSFGRSISGLQQGLGHADAAFSNFSNAQQHENNAYAATQQGYGALINSGVSVAGMGISNYNNAQTFNASRGGAGEVNFGSAFSGQPSYPTNQSYAVG
jgi:hypothetical protein